MPDHYTIHFSKTTAAAYTTWDEGYPYVNDARSRAEQAVDDDEADRAHLTGRHGIDEEYSETGWTDNR